MIETCADSYRGGGWHASDGGPDKLCARHRAIMVERDKADPTTWHLFALRNGNHLDHFYASTTAFSVCGDGEPVIVRLTKDPAGPLWSWYYSHHPSNLGLAGNVSMIFNSEMLLKICFPAGPKHEEERGMGRVIRLQPTVIRPALRGEGPSALEAPTAEPPPVAPLSVLSGTESMTIDDVFAAQDCLCGKP